MAETGPGLAWAAKNDPRRITGNYEIFLYGVALNVPVPRALLLGEFGPVSVLPVAWRAVVSVPVRPTGAWLNLSPFPGRFCGPSPG